MDAKVLVFTTLLLGNERGVELGYLISCSLGSVSIDFYNLNSALTI